MTSDKKNPISAIPREDSKNSYKTTHAKTIEPEFYFYYFFVNVDVLIFEGETNIFLDYQFNYGDI